MLVYPALLVVAALVVAGAVLAVRRRAFGVLFAARRRARGVADRAGRDLHRGEVPGDPVAQLVLLAVAGCAALAADRRLRRAAPVVAVVLAAGVLVSDGMAYRDAYIAPKDRLDELRVIGERYAGDRPTMLDEMEEYGKHFLRDADVIAPFDGNAYAPAQLRVPGPVYDTWADLDEMTLDYVRSFPQIVRRRNPVASRPPAPYRRVFTGDHYEVWRAPAGIPAVVDHLPLGDDNDPTGEVDCGAVRALAARADGGELVAAVRPCRSC